MTLQDSSAVVVAGLVVLVVDTEVVESVVALLVVAGSFL